MGDDKKPTHEPRHIRMDGPDNGEDCVDLFERGITGDKYIAWLKEHLHPGLPLVKKETKPKPKPEPTPAPPPPVAEPPPSNVVAMAERKPVEDLVAVPPEYSEDGVAEQFSDKYHETMKYCGPAGCWYSWKDGLWVKDETQLAIHKARKVCKLAASNAAGDASLGSKAERISNQISTHRMFSAVEKIARTDPRHIVLPTKFDQRSFIINTPGGIVNLRTGQLRPARKEDFCTLSTAVAPDGEENCPQWKQFIHDATAGDPELGIYLQRIAGYCLTASVAEHAFFFCYGGGGNGKGTYINTIQWLLGTYAKVSNMDTFTAQRFAKHSTELAYFKGARLVTAQETDEGSRWNEARIKNLTGGDPITARHMYQSEFTFYPTFKLIFSGNHKPQLRNVDAAIRRRMYLIPFDYKVPREKRIKDYDKIMQADEGPGIMQWAVNGCLDWMQNALNPPTRVRVTTDEYFDSEDKMGSFLDETCEKGEGLREPTSRLYQRYRDWCEESGEYAESRKRFVAALKRYGYPSRNLGGTMVVQGLRLPIKDDYPYK